MKCDSAIEVKGNPNKRSLQLDYITGSVREHFMVAFSFDGKLYHELNLLQTPYTWIYNC